MSLYPLLIVDEDWSYADWTLHHAKGRFHTVATVAIDALGFLGWHFAWSSYHHGTTIQLCLMLQNTLSWLDA